MGREALRLPVVLSRPGRIPLPLERPRQLEMALSIVGSQSHGLAQACDRASQVVFSELLAGAAGREHGGLQVGRSLVQPVGLRECGEEQPCALA